MREEIVWRALISPAFGRLYLATSPGIIQKSSLEMSLEVQEGKKKKYNKGQGSVHSSTT
jgi:hypothetical protein